MAPGSSKRVSPAELRALFNRLDLWAAASAGRLHRERTDQSAANPEYNQPPRTTAEMWSIFDFDGVKIAVVHRYVYEDGRRSLPDPKMVRHEGVTYWTPSGG